MYIVYVHCICMCIYIVYCILYIAYCTSSYMYVLYDIVCVYCICIYYIRILYMYIVCVHSILYMYIVCVYSIYIYMCFMYRNICCTIVDILDIRSLMIPYQAMFLQNNEPGWNVLSSHWSNSQVGLFKLKMGDSSPAYGHLREHDD